MMSIAKSVIVAILCGAILIASFYLAYLLLLVAVLVLVGIGSYLYFNYRNIFKGTDFYD